MKLKSYGNFLFVLAVAAGVPIACSSDPSNGATGSGGQGGGPSGNGGSNPATNTSTNTSTNASTSGSGGAPPVQVDWPEVQSEIPKDATIEAAVAELVGKMTLEQKVGQMVQAEIQAIKPEEVKQYHLGSVLNGGGSWPNNNKNALATDWVALADTYYNASTDTSGGSAGEFLGIPIIWGTDAVHGHSNVKGATLFPHNIGLGAMNDPDLIEQIGAVTASEVAATGLDWSFAPTLAVVQDDRWGRTYEGYSERPEIVKAYAGRMVSGIQGKASDAPNLFSGAHVIGTAKHFLGDGGTNLGKDQGDNLCSEKDLRDIHAQGYLSAIPAGVQTVMASFSSWQGQKMHGNHYLLTDILKGKFHFDGFVIGDWNGHGQVTGCDNTHCAPAINAGVDMIMVPADWKAFITNTIEEVKANKITQARIDDAVTRILRVKMRAGLLGPKKTKGAPSTRKSMGQGGGIGSTEHRAVARKAVQKSLVLLKNKGGVLPISKTKNVLVAGKSADSISNQSGGWTLSWQGTGNTNADFPNAESIYAGINKALTTDSMGGTATLSPDGSAASAANDVAIVVIGETPYAEGQGDITKVQTLEHSVLHPEDLAVIETIRTKAPGVPIVTVLLSGRPLYVNKELNRSDAFVAAFLPGSEGGGVADLLFGKVEFSGKLSYSWPNADCQTPLNPGDSKNPLFPLGFGLTTKTPDTLPNNLPEVSTGHGCDAPDTGGAGTTDQQLPIFMGGANKGDFKMRIGGPSNWGGIDVGEQTSLPGGEVSVSTVDGQVQGSAKQVTWTATGQVYTQNTQGNTGINLAKYANSKTSIVFRAKLDKVPTAEVNLSTHCVYPCQGSIPFGGTLGKIADGQWHELSVPLACMIKTGLDITNVNTPFLLYTEAPLSISLEDIRWEPGTASETPDCSVFKGAKDVIDVPSFPLYTDGLSAGLTFTAYQNDPTQQIDLGGGNKGWVGKLVPGTNIAIHKNGFAADMSAFAATGSLKFDVMVTSYGSAMADVLIKVATNWPSLSDLRLFEQVLAGHPKENVWTTVTIPIKTLMSSDNDLAPGYYLDIATVTDLFVMESILGSVDLVVDNIRFEK